jgi:hypothetical protein
MDADLAARGREALQTFRTEYSRVAEAVRRATASLAGAATQASCVLAHLVLDLPISASAAIQVGGRWLRVPSEEARVAARRRRLQVIHSQILSRAGERAGLGGAELQQYQDAATALRSYYERASEVLDPTFAEQVARARRARDPSLGLPTAPTALLPLTITLGDRRRPAEAPSPDEPSPRRARPQADARDEARRQEAAQRDAHAAAQARAAEAVRRAAGRGRGGGLVPTRRLRPLSRSTRDSSVRRHDAVSRRRSRHASEHARLRRAVSGKPLRRRLRVSDSRSRSAALARRARQRSAPDTLRRSDSGLRQQRVHSSSSRATRSLSSPRPRRCLLLGLLTHGRLLTPSPSSTAFARLAP